METFNIKRILVPIDFSETSLKALDHAVYIAKRNTADITLINVVENAYAYAPSADYTAITFSNLENFEKSVTKQSKEHLLKLAQRIKKKEGVNIIGIVSNGWVKEEILDTADSMKADIIIMGTHGVKGFREFITGSNAFRVVNEAKCPVLSIRKNVEPGFKNILLPFRDKPHSREKVDYAIKMAELYGAKIHVLGIDTDDDAEQFKKIELEAAQIKRIIEKHGLSCNVKVKSSPYLAEKVLKYAKKKKADLVVIMADLDKMRISEYFMGPFAQQMVNHSPLPVLSIRPAFNPETIDLHGYGW